LLFPRFAAVHLQAHQHRLFEVLGLPAAEAVPVPLALLAALVEPVPLAVSVALGLSAVLAAPVPLAVLVALVVSAGSAAHAALRILPVQLLRFLILFIPKPITPYISIFISVINIAKQEKTSRLKKACH
jgi:hypothetical protein